LVKAFVTLTQKGNVQHDIFVFRPITHEPLHEMPCIWAHFVATVLYFIVQYQYLEENEWIRCYGVSTVKSAVQYIFGLHYCPKTSYTAVPNDKISPWDFL